MGKRVFGGRWHEGVELAAVVDARKRCAGSGWALAAAFFLVFVATLGFGTSTASAHTRLVETFPADRTVSAEQPEQLTLVFAEAVDPRSVRLEIIASDGETIEGSTLLTPTGKNAEVIQFALPDLGRGIFGLSWATVGPDGHRVAGEVVVGVGIVDEAAVAAASFTRTPTLDRALEVVSGIGRFGWYIALAAVVGSLLVLGWNLRGPQPPAAASAILANAARRSLVAGALILFAAILTRTVATIALITRGYGDGPLRENLRLALAEGTGRTLLMAVVGTGALAVLAARLGRSRSELTLLQAGIGIVVLIAFGATPGHTVTLSEDPFGIWVSTLHLAAASVWLGPLLILAAAMATTAWRQRPNSERSAATRELFRRFAPAAVAAFAVLALTGLRSTWLLAGGELLKGSGYATVLLVKLGLVVMVAVPLAVYHDRRVGWLARFRRPAGQRSATIPPRTLRLESWALSGIIAVAAILTGLNPASLDARDAQDLLGATADDAEGTQTGGYDLALLSNEPPASTEECALRTLGMANCYRDYFSSVMQSQGADKAVDMVEELSKTDNFVARNCHQITHDLGNDAVVWYGDVGTALTYEGSACWSGYYHGVVEYALGEFDDAELAEELPGFCSVVAARQYSFDHFNCVHGLGHGIMKIVDGDLFETIPYCEVFSDPWEDSTCMNGALMENMILGQQGTPTYLRVDDLVYPCNAIPELYVADCFATQTSWILHNVGYDTSGFAEVFSICNRVRSDMVDNCYLALGRDISSVHDQDPSTIVRLCSLGDPAYQADCYVGAATNTIYNNHNTIQATVICQSIRTSMQPACFEARDRVAATL